MYGGPMKLVYTTYLHQVIMFLPTNYVPSSKGPLQLSVVLTRDDHFPEHEYSLIIRLRQDAINKNTFRTPERHQV